MCCIDVYHRGTITHGNKYRKRTICLSCMFSHFYIKSPFDNKIFTEDNKIFTVGNGGIYSTRFRVYEYKIAELITSLLSNRVVGGILISLAALIISSMREIFIRISNEMSMTRR